MFIIKERNRARLCRSRHSFQNQKKGVNIMKLIRRLVALILAMALTLTCASALALGFTGRQGNVATFETLEEARVSSPEAVQALEGNASKTFATMAILDGIPENTVFIYRSANLYGGRAAGRLNTNIVVYADARFEDKAEAKAYLEDLGLIEIVDEAIGSIILVTPSVGVSMGSSGLTGGYGQADQLVYYKLQCALCSLQASSGGFSFPEPEYFGGFGYIYVIGFDSGATFLNNYVASTFDFASRIAGMLLVNSKMDVYRQVSTFVPVYLVNPAERVLEQYKAVNGADATDEWAEYTVYYNQQFPLRKVILANAEHDDAYFVQDAWKSLFSKAMRIPVGIAGLNSSAMPLQGVGNDRAPYSLFPRNYIGAGETADGLVLLERQKEDRFSAYQSDAGEYMDTWYEYVPRDVLENTALPGSVPLVLALHGAGDDPRLFVDEMGLLDLASRVKMVIVAPEHNSLGGGVRTEADAFPALIEYLLETYPALDATRVYVMGYSMGGGSTMRVMMAHPEIFAAAAPMSAVTLFGDIIEPSEEDLAQFSGIDLPVLLTTSGADLMNTYDQANDHILPAIERLENMMLSINELPEVEFDYDAYPINGFVADQKITKVLNGEYVNRTWMFYKESVPMVGLSITEALTHNLYPAYGDLFWDFVKHYSRDLETGDVIYTEYVK